MFVRNSLKMRFEKRRLRIIATVGIVLLIFGGIGCGLESPKAPAWTVDIQVPLSSRHFDVPYIIEQINIDELSWSADSGIAFTIDRELDSVFVGENLTIADLQTHADFSIDSVRLAVAATVDKTIPLDDIYSGPVGLIAAFEGETRQTLPAIVSFETAHVTEGRLAITVSNNLGLTLESVTARLYATGSGVAFATIPVGGPILTGTESSAEASLSAIEINGEWDVELSFTTPGGTLLSASDKSVTVLASLPDGIQITSGTGVVAPFEINTSNDVTFSNEHAVHQATLKQGLLTLAWENHTPLPMSVQWEANGFERDGVPLGGVITLDALDARVEIWNVAEFVADIANHPSIIRINTTLSSSGSGSDALVIETESALSVDATFEDVVLANGLLALASTTHQIATLSTRIDWPHGMESVGLADGTASVEVTSSLPWPAELSGVIETSSGARVAFSGNIAAANGTPVVSTIDLGDISALLHPLPQQLTITGTARYGDGETVAYIADTDFLASRVIVRAPANLLLDSAAVSGDVERVEIGGDPQDREDRFLGGEVTLEIVNRLPFGAELLVTLASDSAALFSNPELILGPSRIDAAITNAAGDAIEPTSSSLTFVLDAADVALFEREIIWVTEELILQGPSNTVPARVALSDYLDLTATARLSARMGDRALTEVSR